MSPPPRAGYDPAELAPWETPGNGEDPYADVPPPTDADAPDDRVRVVELVDPSWSPVDLAPVLAGTYSQPVPDVLTRDDGQCVLYRGMVNGIHADSGIGKGWVASLALVQQMQRGHDVALIDLEDVPGSIVARLRLLGATDDQIGRHLVYLRPQTGFSPLAVDQVADVIGARAVSVVVIDSLGEAFGLDGIDEDRDAQVGPWMRRVSRRLADAGAAVLHVDHATKAADNPLHPSGSKRKRAAIGGASYLVTATKPLTAEHGGRLRLTCAKDRHGNYARGEHVADFVMKVHPDRRVHCELYAAADPTDTGVNVAAELAARAAVATVKAVGRPMSKREVLATMPIKAGSEIKRAGIDIAIGRGALLATDGPRRAVMITFESDLPEHRT